MVTVEPASPAAGGLGATSGREPTFRYEPAVLWSKSEGAFVVKQIFKICFLDNCWTLSFSTSG